MGSTRTLPLQLMLWTLALVAGVQGIAAAELVMFEDAACPWCRRWHAEIGPGYPDTEEGRRAPLRRVDIGDQANAGVVLMQPVTATPTFVLIEDGREVGRVVGYPGSDFFYGLLGEVLARLPRQRGGSLPPGIAPAAEGAGGMPM
jgi:protein-disulfide isomerase